MSRTQVYLGADELALLERAAQASGASRSELIRRAIRRTFGESGMEERLRALDASAGSWGGRGTAGAEYVDEVRGDLGERLRRLGLLAPQVVNRDARVEDLIRAAVDEYLADRPAGIDEALADSFGAVPEAEAPSRADWARRELGTVG